jgi:hypothetical protein
MAPRPRSALLLAALCVAGGATPVAAGAAVDTGVVNVSRTPGFGEGEESISVSPTDPRQILIGSNQYQPGVAPPGAPVGSKGIMLTALWHSGDGGRTWRLVELEKPGTPVAGEEQPVELELPGEFKDSGNVDTTDQHSVYDRRGRAYYETGEVSSPYTGFDIVGFVWRSDNGGRTFGKPSIPYSFIRTLIQPDRPWLAIDNSRGPHAGTVYFSWQTALYQGIDPQVWVRASTDGGRTWHPHRRVDNGLQETQFNPRAFPEVGADGTLYFVYNRALFTTPAPTDPELTPIEIVVARSADRGERFQYSTVDDNVRRVESPDEALPTYTEMISAMATDPARPGRIAVAWPNESTPESSRILMRYSTDGGRTWSRRVDVGDAPGNRPSSRNQHDHVTATYLYDGRLVVVWRDRRCCGGTFTSKFEVFARVFDVDRRGRLTPGRTIRLTRQAQEPTTGRRGGAVGEYIDAAATRDRLLGSWDELRGVYSDNVFRAVPLTAFGAARGCLSRRSPIGPRNIGRVRLGRTRRELLRIPVLPTRRTRYTYRWCVKRSSGRVTAVFSSRSRRGRALLLTTTARAHGNRLLRPGSSAGRLSRAYPNRRRVGPGLYRARRGSPRLIGLRRGRVRFFAVAHRRLLRDPRALRRYLRRAGL